jgi:S-adenosylmethionine:tRNA-ribosyltransferase-isomerase (queuine synthetase)
MNDERKRRIVGVGTISMRKLDISNSKNFILSNRQQKES